MELDDRQLDGLRTHAQPIPLDADARSQWVAQFNLIPAVTHFGAVVDLSDSTIVRVRLAAVREEHLGGLRLRAVNGAVLAGLFDCAMGVAGTLQFPGKRAGTCELALKFMRAAFDEPLEVFSVCTKKSGNLAFAASELYSNGRLCATGTGIVAVAADRGGEEPIW